MDLDIERVLWAKVGAIKSHNEDSIISVCMCRLRVHVNYRAQPQSVTRSQLEKTLQQQPRLERTHVFKK